MFCGALTSKPYAFKVRPWELRSLDAIDIFDGTGSNIRIDFKNYEILRILPKFNQDVNDFWISNKIRYFFDSLTYQRLTYPYIKHRNSFIKLRWKSIFFLLKNIFSTFIYEYHHNTIQLIGSSNLNTLDLYALKIFTKNLSLNLSKNNDFLVNNIDFPSCFRFVLPVKALSCSNLAVLLGCDTRLEAPTLNIKLRNLSNQGNLFIFQNSLLYNNNYSSSNVGFLTTFLDTLVKGKHSFCKRLISSTNPFFLVGNSLFHRYDFTAISNLLYHLKFFLFKYFKKFMYINYLHNYVNSVGTLELGLFNSSFFPTNNKKCLFWLDQSFFLKKSFFFKNSFNICCSSFGFDTTKKGDILLPTTLFIEEDSLFYNFEGKINFVKKGLPNPNLALPLWQILTKLLFFFKRKTNFASVPQLIISISSFLPRTKRYFDKINDPFDTKKKQRDYHPIMFCNPVSVEYPGPADSWNSFNFKFFFELYCFSLIKQKLVKSHYKIYVYDFYKSHFLCESSILMNKASLLIRTSHINYSFLKKKYS